MRAGFDSGAVLDEEDEEEEAIENDSRDETEELGKQFLGNLKLSSESFEGQEECPDDLPDEVEYAFSSSSS